MSQSNRSNGRVRSEFEAPRGAHTASSVGLRTALHRGEDGEVDALFEVVRDSAWARDLALAEEDHRRTRTTQRLVRRRRHQVAVPA